MVTAVQHVRRMRGGSQSHLMRASDGNLYVVKFQNNPQHVRVLANEVIVTRLAEIAGLPVPACELIEVSEWIIQNTPDLHIQVGSQRIPCTAGLAYGSRYALSPAEGQVLDWIPLSMVDRVRNLDEFSGMLAFDKWVCNSDSRQAVFIRHAREGKYKAVFIDHGYCFNAAEWTFPDAPVRGAYAWNEVYAGVTGWESFEPWLSRLEEMNEDLIAGCGNIVPPGWYESDNEALEKLLASLIKRRSRIRELIESFQHSSRKPFPNWQRTHSLTRPCRSRE